MGELFEMHPVCSVALERHLKADYDSCGSQFLGFHGRCGALIGFESDSVSMFSLSCSTGL